MDEPEPELHIACSSGDVDAVLALLNRGANVNATNMYKDTALHHETNVQIARLLIDNGANVNAIGYLGRTPLLMAIIGGHTDIIDLLLARGANIHQGSALIYAARYCTFERLKLLLEYGANPNAYDHRGDTALYWAVYRRRPKVVSILMSYGADPTICNLNGISPMSIMANKDPIDPKFDKIRMLLEGGGSGTKSVL